MANTNIKKVAKHSKRFERTQTGCLQCRQKKKKCDGKRPKCQTCEKKGVSCDYPANIRIFQFNQDSSSRKNSTGSTSGVTASSKKSGSFKQIDLKKEAKDEKDDHAIVDDELDIEVEDHEHEHDHSHDEDDIDDKLDYEEDDEVIETQQSLNNLSQKIGQILDDKQVQSIPNNIETKGSISSQTKRNDSIISELNSRSDSIISLISDTDSDSQGGSFTTQPSTPPSGLNLKPSSYKISESQRATNMIHDGESINKILDDMTIDLIKRSINNLQYINFDKKINSFQKSNEFSKWNLIDGKNSKDDVDVEVVGNDDVYFQPDEFLSFD